MVPVGTPAEGWAREIRKGALDLALLCLLRPAPLHGYPIIKALRERRLIPPDGSEATVYQALQRLAGHGYLRADWKTPEGGRPRKSYQLTKVGQQALTGMQDEWQAFVADMDAVVRGQVRASKVNPDE